MDEDKHVMIFRVEVRPQQPDDSPIRTATRWKSRLMHTAGIWKVDILWTGVNNEEPTK